jgi:hypothetical protein
MTDDLTRFYNLLGVLAARPEQGKPLSQYSGRVVFPARGVYFFIEPGEYRASNPTARRVVRVGTHAVSANSKSKLWGDSVPIAVAAGAEVTTASLFSGYTSAQHSFSVIAS